MDSSGKKLIYIDFFRILIQCGFVIYFSFTGVVEIFFAFAFVEIVTMFWKNRIISVELRDIGMDEIRYENSTSCWKW